MGRDEALVGSHESNTFAGALVAETERHLQHGVMFMDGERKVQCLCGWTCSYEEAEERGFGSWENGRIGRKKKSVMDAFARLHI